MDKAYERINWEDEPSISTPLAARLLNRVDYATNEIDNRVIVLDTGKANQVDELLDIKEVTYNSTTGVWTFTHQNGTVDTFDQNIEKIPVTFSMDENGVITMTTADGTTYTCDVGTLIKTYTFVNSGNIQFTVTTDAQGNKSVTANIIDGSITRAKLDPDYLAQIDLDVASASASALAASGSATAASGSATTASNKALDSEAYAIGTRGGVPVTSEDPAYENNSKYYAEQAEQTDIGQVNNEIADIVNVYGAKNLIPYPYYETTKTSNGITFTDNGDGTVTVNGTATSKVNFWFEHYSLPFIYPNGSYLLSDGGVGSSGVSLFFAYYNDTTWVSQSNVSDNGEIPITVSHSASSDYDRTLIGIIVKNGTTVNNLTFKPMLRLASISDNTYVPYVPTNAKLDEEKISWDDVTESVQKNLIPYPYADTSKTGGGLTWTDNGDGTITVDGTSTSANIIWFVGNNFNIEANKRYLLTGMPSDAASSDVYLQLQNVTGLSFNNRRDEGNGVIITSTSTGIARVQIGVVGGKTVNNLTFKPMLRPASIKDDTYAPYVLNNNQLVGWSQAEKSVKKNLNSYPYYNTTRTGNGITWTDNGDGTITANGTATANAFFYCHSRNITHVNSLIVPNGSYILTGCPANGSTSTYLLQAEITRNNAAYSLARETGDGAIVTVNGDDYFSDKVNIQIQCIVKSGTTVNNLVFKPMLRYANVKDDTFVPYIPDNTELVSWKANGILGAKNLMPYPYFNESGTVNRGITWTYDNTGVLTANGTVSEANLESFFSITGRVPLTKGRYTVNGCPNDGGSTKYWITVYNSNNTEICRDYGSGATFTIQNDGETIYVQSRIYRGTTVNNLVFKPMLRLASDTDDTYQPYAMTNYELTQKIAELQAQINALV